MVMQHLANVILALTGTISLNLRVPRAESLLRPDTVICDEGKKQITIVNVLPFPSRTEEKPWHRPGNTSATPLIDVLKQRGYEVLVFVGALSSWDLNSEPLNPESF